MAEPMYCDVCSVEDTFSSATQYCCQCEEKLCKECTESHSLFKKFKSHNLIDLASTGFTLAPLSQKYCEIHPNAVLDFYCTQHDVACCCACIPSGHPSCDKVMPLDSAAENVKNSSLLSETLDDLNSLTETVTKLIENRDANLKFLEQARSLILQQINTVKSRLLKQIDELTCTLMTQLTSVQEKNETKINGQKEGITMLNSELRRNRDELEYFKSHGSNKQLFLSLRHTISDNRKLEIDIERLLPSFEEIEIKYDEVLELSLKTMGSIYEITKPCTVQYSSQKMLQAQVLPDDIKPLTVFEKVEEVNLKSGEIFFFTDMAVTSDNKLLLCNYHTSCPKVFIYRDCKEYENEIQFPSKPYSIAVIPDTDTAVVTLPQEKSIQFINTTQIEKKYKVQLEFQCWVITASNDNIIVDGSGVIHVMDRYGTPIKEVRVGRSCMRAIHYDKRNDRILCRYMYEDEIRCITLDGKFVYQHKVSGQGRLAVDHQGHVYLSLSKNEIYRLSSDGTSCDIVLTKDHGVNYPSALSFNNDFTKLFVVDVHKTVVYAFICK